MKNTALLFFCLASLSGYSQENQSFTQVIHNLYTAGSIHEAAKRNEEIEKAWNGIKNSGIPFVKDDSVAFFYRGEATHVEWMGDFNGWGFRKTFPNKGKKIHGTNIWVFRTSFPKDARLDYKILVNSHQWLLDPENPHQQSSGVGGGSLNSELRMPLWKSDPIQNEIPGIAHGVIKRDILLASKILGYQITYSVYLPAGYEKSGKLPVLYVTDGYEYLSPELGNMATVLDNLIAQKKIRPIIAIFVEDIDKDNLVLLSDIDLTFGINTSLKQINAIKDELSFNESKIYNADIDFWDISFSFVQAAYLWAKGYGIVEISASINIYEGNFIRNITKINNIIHDLINSLEIINKIELMPKLQKIEELLIRDIVITKSLYITS